MNLGEHTDFTFEVAVKNNGNARNLQPEKGKWLGQCAVSTFQAT